jgi:predicted transcriptional regulator
MKKSSSVTTIRLTEDARRLLWRLGETLGISRTAVIELAIRRMAAEEEIEARPAEVMEKE